MTYCSRMKRALFAIVLFAAASAIARPITEKDLFRFIWIGDPQISPDGSRVVFTRVTVDDKKTGYNTELWTVGTRGDEAPRRLTNGPRDTSPRWSPDGKSIAFLRSAEKQPAQIYLLSLIGGEPHAVTKLAKGAGSVVWSPKGDVIAFVSENTAEDEKKKDKDKKEDDEYVSDVRVINQAVYRDNDSGYLELDRHGHIWTVRPFDEKAEPKQFTTGEFDEGDLAWSPDASRIYFTSERVRESYYNDTGSRVYSVPAGGGDITLIAGIKGDLDMPVPSPDGKWIALRGSEFPTTRSYDQPDLYLVSTTPGSTPRNVTGSYDFDVMSGLSGDQRAPRGNRASRMTWSADSKSLMITTAEKGTVNLMRLDAASGAITPITRGNHEVQAFSTLANGNATVALVSTPTAIGDLFRVDANGSLARLTDFNGPLFSELTLTAPDEIWYTSFDGKKVETWAQKPPNYQAGKKYPAILNIHGGPHAAYGYTFDHEFQWMAAKGYVVIYPNPRGSTSYGQDFGNVIQYAYPGDDYKDLMAAVDELVKRGVVDESKLGVTGGSGGGVLTNWIVGHTDRFKAAASQRSIADWATWWYTDDFWLYRPRWFRKAPFQDPADYTARSPLTYVEKVHTPLMLIEGESDYRTPPSAGGEMMFRALKYLHRPTVMVRFPGETHELSRSGRPWHRVERLEHIVNWMDKYVLGAKIDLYDAGLLAP